MLVTTPDERTEIVDLGRHASTAASGYRREKSSAATSPGVSRHQAARVAQTLGDSVSSSHTCAGIVSGSTMAKLSRSSAKLTALASATRRSHAVRSSPGRGRGASGSAGGTWWIRAAAAR